jgi:hypothetical protein
VQRGGVTGNVHGVSSSACAERAGAGQAGAAAVTATTAARMAMFDTTRLIINGYSSTRRPLTSSRDRNAGTLVWCIGLSWRDL